MRAASGSVFAVTLDTLSSAYFLGASLFLFVVAFPPLEDATSVDLTFHTSQHVLIVLAGALVGYSLYKKGRSRSVARRRDLTLAIAGLAAVSPLVVYWHLPQNWDAAVQNPVTHALEHVSFLGVGVVIGLLVPMPPSVGTAGVMLLDYVAHTYYAFVLATAEVPVYALYSVRQQSTLSVFILGYSNGLLAVCVLAWAYLRLSRKALAAEAASVAPQRAPLSHLDRRRIEATTVVFQTHR